VTHIAIDCRMLDASGIGTYIRSVVPRIVRLRPDWQFALIGPEARMQETGWTSSGNATVMPCDAPIYGIREQFAVLRCIARETSLFWSPHYDIPVLYRGNMLVTVHDVLHLAMPQYAKGLLKQSYARAMFRAVRHRARAVICVSDFTVAELQRLAPPSRQVVRRIYPGVDRSWFDVAEAPSPHARPYLVYVGNVKPHKNLHTLLDAFSRVKDAIAQDLIIVGEREGFLSGDATIAEHARELGDRIVFTGYVSDDQLRQYVGHATALVFPSLYEGFGLPPLEAMAAGCPVLASDAASIPEACGDAALYCDARNTDDLAAGMVRIVQDGELRDTLRRRGRERAWTFSWDACAEETVGVMLEVLER
jgi:glycosyltransferase involved in cell wall biosynthesis